MSSGREVNSHSVILLSGLACRVAEKRTERTPPSYYEGGAFSFDFSESGREPGDYVASTSPNFGRSHPYGHHARDGAPQPWTFTLADVAKEAGVVPATLIQRFGGTKRRTCCWPPAAPLPGVFRNNSAPRAPNMARR